ncbi:MAG: response regulator [Planctomycetota bacterium]
MLVLSRRQDDKILFPALGISVHLLRVDGGRVRVGIDAPPEVKVLRHELKGTPDSKPPAVAPVTLRDARLKKHLHTAAESLNHLHELCESDTVNGSDDLIFEVFHHLKSIDEEIAAEANRKPVIKHTPQRTALLVDDNANECHLLASYLRLRHFDVAIANDGAAALDYLSSNDDPDVVLLDMQMPGMDGPTAIRRMRAQERYNDLQVFAVSGGDPSDYGVDVSPQGVNGWFPKPLDPEAMDFRLALEDSPVTEATALTEGAPA